MLLILGKDCLSGHGGLLFAQTVLLGKLMLMLHTHTHCCNKPHLCFLIHSLSLLTTSLVGFTGSILDDQTALFSFLLL